MERNLNSIENMSFSQIENLYDDIIEYENNIACVNIYQTVQCDNGIYADRPYVVWSDTRDLRCDTNVNYVKPNYCMYDVAARWGEAQKGGATVAARCGMGHYGTVCVVGCINTPC